MHLFRIGSIIGVLNAAVKHHQTMNALEACGSRCGNKRN